MALHRHTQISPPRSYLASFPNLVPRVFSKKGGREKTLASASILCISLVCFGLLPHTVNFFKTVYAIDFALLSR